MTDTGENLLRERARKFVSQGDGHTYTVVDSLEAFVRAELERAAEIADHFAQDELTEEEWPTSGLAEYGKRADAGVIRRCGENVAAAIRRRKE